MNHPLIELRDISKSFGKVQALSGVDFFVNESEIVGLVGDNGAGKSTLIKIISGVHQPDTGEIFVRGELQKSWSVGTARRAGIETVYQDRALVEQQTITNNIFLGRELVGPLGFINVRNQKKEAERLMRDIGFTSKVFSPDSIVGVLSGGERQGVAIARALYFKAQLVILDEPTAALSLTESEKVFFFVRRLRQEGCSSIFISHNIYHTYDIADRFVVIDRGQVVLSMAKNELSVESLVKRLQDFARQGAIQQGAITNVKAMD